MLGDNSIHEKQTVKNNSTHYRCGFFTPPVVRPDALAALVASCFRGAFPPVDFRAVCFVRAMLDK